MKKQKVSIIGLGYVGLPLAVAIAKSGRYDVMGLDLDKKKVSLINKKVSPLEDAMVKEEIKKFPIKATTAESNLKGTDIFIIAVPTPVDEDYVPNYGPIKGASKTVAKYLKKGATVILESTVNPGTCEEVVLPVLERVSKLKGGVDFNLVHCPERINPGDPKWNVYNIARNIGSLDADRNNEIADFYRSFLKAEINEVSSLKIAEATKIIENTFRDINIAYVNELAKSFDKMGIDLIETIQAASNKPFAYMPHWPGAGVGGHCIAVDPYYLIRRAARAGFDHKFLKMARHINNSMPKYAVRRLKNALKEANLEPEQVSVAVLGLSYKRNVPDLRESPALEILQILKEEKIKTIKFDPHFPDLSTAKTLEETLEKADAAILVTGHKEFLKISARQLKEAGIQVILDGRNVLNKEAIRNANIIYKGIGR